MTTCILDNAVLISVENTDLRKIRIPPQTSYSHKQQYGTDTAWSPLEVKADPKQHLLSFTCNVVGIEHLTGHRLFSLMQSKQKQRKIWLSKQGLSQVHKHLLRLQLWNGCSRFWCTPAPPLAPPAPWVIAQCREVSQGLVRGAVPPPTIRQRQETVQLCCKSHHRRCYERGQLSEGTFPMDCNRADVVSSITFPYTRLSSYCLFFSGAQDGRLL